MHKSIEALETRIAPAAVFTYTETDGDIVTVKTSAKVSDEYFRSLASFDGEDLSNLNLNDPIFQNTDLKITVKKAGGGNGIASIGTIQGSVDLRNVTIKGNVGLINMGDSNEITAPVKKLQVHDLGSSTFDGNVGAIKIQGNLVGYLEADRIKSIKIAGSAMPGVVIESDDIGSIVIGGDMAGYFTVDKSIGSVRIGGSLQSESGSGGIIEAREIKSLTIGKSIIGSENIGSSINVRSIGKLMIGGDVIGGEAGASGQINVTEIGVLKIKGDVIGGAGQSSGRINSNKIGTLQIGGDLEGGSGDYSGVVSADEGGSIDKIVIGKSIIGGTGITSGAISASYISSAAIGKSITGGEGESSASVQSLSLESIRIGKNLTGGSGSYSGAVSSIRGIGEIRIGGDLQGGSGERSGWVNAVESGSVDKIVVGGSIIGGAGTYSGAVEVDHIVSASVGRSILGGGGQYSGSLFAHNVGKVSVARDVIGGGGSSSGFIGGIDGIESVKIGNNLTGGDGDHSGTVRSPGGLIGSVVVGGNLSNATGKFTGIVAQSLGSVTIGGRVTGSEYGTLLIRAAADSHPANSAVPAIGSVKIKGSVTNLHIGAGTDLTGYPASIGSVDIGGDFKTSSIVAGISPGPDGFFGTPDDVIPAAGPEVVSRIASVVIRKSVIGSPGIEDDGYGIFAQHIQSLKVKGVKQMLETGPTNDLTPKLLGGTDDVRYAEVPLVLPT